MNTTTPVSENSKKTSDNNNQNKTIRTSKTVDDALNKLLKLTENLIHVVPRTHANVSHMITREILLFYHHSVFAHSLLFCSGGVCVRITCWIGILVRENERMSTIFILIICNNNSNSNHNTGYYCFWCGSMNLARLCQSVILTTHLCWNKRFLMKKEWVEMVKICCIVLLYRHCGRCSSMQTWMPNSFCSFFPLVQNGVADVSDFFLWILWTTLNAILKCYYFTLRLIINE